MTTHATARVQTSCTENFPALEHDTATILIALEDGGYSVYTNIGAGTKVVGVLLHQLSHVLAAGETVDISDLLGPIPTDLAGGVE